MLGHRLIINDHLVAIVLCATVPHGFVCFFFLRGFFPDRDKDSLCHPSHAEDRVVQMRVFCGLLFLSILGFGCNLLLYLNCAFDGAFHKETLNVLCHT